MDDNKKPSPVSADRLAVGMFSYGAGTTLALVTVLYKHVPEAKLHDLLLLAGFALILYGWRLARRAPF